MGIGAAALCLGAAAWSEEAGMAARSVLRLGPRLQLAADAVSKLGAAAVIGVLVTAVHRPAAQGGLGAGALAHTQVLLCVAGALMMLVIEDSLARAFGIAGAASIIRFRTPVDNPKDAVVLFLLMALGMASGLGVFALGLTGMAVLCGLLFALDRWPRHVDRAWVVAIVATGQAYPAAHVRGVFARHGVIAEPREVSGGERAATTYVATCRSTVLLETLNDELLAGGESGVGSVAWEPARKKLL